MNINEHKNGELMVDGYSKTSKSAEAVHSVSRAGSGAVGR